MKLQNFDLRSAGYCEANQAAVLKGSAFKDVKFYATYAYFEHPIHGHILFDTGYTERFYTETAKYPMKLYGQITKVFVKTEDKASVVLENHGIKKEEVNFIIISHFHADHIGGLKDFPNANFIYSTNAYNAIKDKTGIAALKNGFIPGLIPENFEQRSQTIIWNNNVVDDPILGKMHDLFGDGSILLCQLDGHAKGQIGALLETEDQKVMLIADAAWVKKNYEDFHLPSPVVRLFIDSWSDFKVSLKRVHNYAKANPETLIIPCHCETTFKEFSKKIII